MVLGQGVIEHNVSIRPMIFFDSGWRRIFLVTKVPFLDCDLESFDKKEADVFVYFSGHLDAIGPTLLQITHPVFKCQQPP